MLLSLRTLETDFIFKPSASRYAMMLVMDVLATQLALLQQEPNKERLRRLKYVLDAHRGPAATAGNRWETEMPHAFDTLIRNVTWSTGPARRRAWPTWPCATAASPASTPPAPSTPMPRRTWWKATASCSPRLHRRAHAR